MDELILKRLRGEATDIEVRQLDHWRAESPENDLSYSAFHSLWKGAGEPEAPAVGPAPALDEIVREGDARRTRGRNWAARRAAFSSPWARSGLMVAAAAALVFLALPSDAGQDSPIHGLFPVESSSSPNDVTTLGLSDGSVVRMTPETRLEFPATRDRREVVLEGRAFFAVAADPVPFVVRTPLGDVTVQGTRFEVGASGDELRLVVVEGRVRLDGGSGSVDVGPGQVAFLRPGSSPQVMDHGDVWSVMNWPDGLLVYEATPLSLVVEELGRHFGRTVILEDDTLGQLRITAWFEDESMEEVISAVCLVAGVPCEVTGGDVRIGR